MLTGALLLSMTACQKPIAPPEEPYPADSGGVKVHWDVWTEYEAAENDYTRRYEDYTDRLIPAEDYGELIAFPGKYVDSEWMDGYLYGLVTKKGEIIVDPVYTQVYRQAVYDNAARETKYLPFLVLQKVVGSKEEYVDISEYTIAALDGSWCSETYRGRVMGGNESYFMIYTEDDRVVVLGKDGKEVWSKTAEEMGLDMGRCSWTIEEGVFALWKEQIGCLYDLASGEYLGEAAEDVGYLASFSDGLSLVYKIQNEERRAGYVDQYGQWVLEPIYLDADPFYNGYAKVTFPDGSKGMIDTAGNTVLYFEEGNLFVSYGKGENVLYIHVQSNPEMKQIGTYHYDVYSVLSAYDRDLQPSDVLSEGDQIVWNWGNYWLLEEDRLIVGIAEDQVPVEIPEGYNLGYTAFDGDHLSVYFDKSDGGDSIYRIYNSDGKRLVEEEMYHWVSSTYDIADGRTYLVGADQRDRYTLMRFDGAVLLENLDTYPQVTHGMAIVQDHESVALIDLKSGEQVFRYLVMNSDV